MPSARQLNYYITLGFGCQHFFRKKYRFVYLSKKYIKTPYHLRKISYLLVYILYYMQFLYFISSLSKFVEIEYI